MNSPYVNTADGPKPRPSAATIKAVWESFDVPSYRLAQERLRLQGFVISAKALGQCVLGGFLPFGWELSFVERRTRKKRILKPRDPHAPPEIDHVATHAASEATPEAIVDAVMERIKNMSPERRSIFEDWIDKTPEEIQARILKVDLVAQLAMKEEFARSAKLMMVMPDKAALLYKALGGAVATPLPMQGLQPSVDTDGSAARVIDGREIEQVLSPSAQAISSFRKTHGLAS